MSFAVGAPAPTSVAGFRHEAFLYRSDAECVAGVQAFVDEGADRGEAAFVVAPAATLHGLRRDGGRPGVYFEEARGLAHNPARLIPAVRSFLDDHDGEHGVRVVLEPLWPGRTRPEMDEVVRHEALANLAFAGRNVSMLCPYNASGLEGEMAGYLARTHPEIVEGGGWHASEEFAEPSTVIDPKAWPLPPAPWGSASVELSRDALRQVRQFVRQQATTAGLDHDRVVELVLAVNEVVTNSLVHGAGRGVLRAWAGTQEVVCEVSDDGTIDDPLAGRWPPSHESEGCRGLWLVNQLCDLVELRSGAGGTRVRLHMTCG